MSKKINVEEERAKFEATMKAQREVLARSQEAKRKAFEETLKLRLAKEAEEEQRAKEDKTEDASSSAAVSTKGEESNSSECPGKAANKCEGCPSKDQCQKNAAAAKELNDDIAVRMQMVMHRILVLSGKGGVGKSMVSTQLAFALCRQGYSVGLLDIDICGPTVPKMLGVEGKDVIKGGTGLIPVQVTDKLCAMSIGFLVDDQNAPIIWRGPRKLGLIQTFLRDVDWGVLDYLIVDTPPGTSDEHISIVQLLTKAAQIDGAVVVTSPQDVSVIEVSKEINFCKKMGVPLMGVVENFGSFACPKCENVTDIWPATSGGGVALAKQHGIPFLGKIPLDPSLAKAGEMGAEITKEASAPTFGAIEDITGKIVAKVKEIDDAFNP